ncbi:MAG: hypothetical protein RL760_124, partial [Candidatus Eisenbacteria bacterium]
MRLRSLALLLVVLGLAPLAHAADDAVYKTPPTVVADLLTAPRVPRGAPNASPDGAWLAVSDLRSLIPIATLAEPVVKLAGLEVLPGMWANRSGLKNAAAGLSFYRVSDGSQVRAKLPEGVQVGLVRWSSKGDRVAVQTFATGGGELWIVTAATGAARRLDGVRLHGVSNVLEWSNDDRALFVSLVVDGEVRRDGSRVPAGPAVRRSAGRATPQRTARDVLRTPEDQVQFATTVTAQLAWVGTEDGAVRPVGAPVALAGVDLSPDEKSVVVRRFTLPAPLGFPAFLFPRKVELWPLDKGAPIALGDVPLNDRSAVASVAPLGPREFTYAPDGRSLWFVAWEDTPGASPQAAVRDTALPPPGRDRILRLDAPFTGAPVEVARGTFPVDGLLFSWDGTRLIVVEGYEPRRVERQWWLDVREPATRGVLVSRSTEGVYDAPGTIALRGGRHDVRAWTTADGKAFYRIGEGYRADGQRPFLDRCAFDGSRTARLFESEAS